MPVSGTASRISHRPRRAGRRSASSGDPVTRTTTSPVSVNLIEFDSRLSDDLAQPPGVADDAGGQVRVDRVGELEVLLRGDRAHHVERALDRRGERERVGVELEPAGLDLREVEDVVDDRQQRLARRVDRLGVVALLAVERRVEEQPAHPDHARSSASGSRGSSRRGTRSSPGSPSPPRPAPPRARPSGPPPAARASRRPRGAGRSCRRTRQRASPPRPRSGRPTSPGGRRPGRGSRSRRGRGWAG